MEVLLGYLLIFVARVLDVTMATFRMLMVVQGRKFYSACIGFIEIIIYITALNQVVSNLENIWNLLVYALGFACGNYIGILIEEKIALGTLAVQIIHKEKSSDELVNTLRDQGFGVTILSGMGREGSRDVISVVIRRKDLPKLKKQIYEFDPNAFIITNSISSISGGYFSTIKKK